MLQKMKLGYKLIGSFVIVAVITLVVGFLGWNGARTMNRHINDIGSIRLPAVQNLLLIKFGFEQLRTAQRTLLNPSLSSEERQRQFANIDKARACYQDAWKQFEILPRNDDEEQLWRAFVPAVANWKTENDRFFEAVQRLEKTDITNPVDLRKNLAMFRGDHCKVLGSTAEAILHGDLFEGGEDHSTCNFGRWSKTFQSDNSVLSSTMREIDGYHSDFHKGVREIKQMVKAGNVTGASRRYKELKIDAEKTFVDFDKMLAEAEKAEQLYRTMDDLAMNACQEKRKVAIGYLEKIVEDNLNGTAISKTKARNDARFTIVLAVIGMFVGTLFSLALGIFLSTSISRILQNIIRGLTEGSHQVASASEQLSSSSQQLSEGATEQASSLEEVSSSLEEMASMTKNNADNAREANGVAQDAGDASQASEMAMNKMSDAIEKIKTSSDETAKIIKTIDEIAMQTNLLALNAAVEAARAGEAGRGFAVVAEEVRNLAQRSAEAARNTAALIEEAQKNAENGVTAATEVKSTSGLIKDAVARVAQLIAEVSAASQEQSQGIEQINTAVAEMDKVTQSNAANAEESASASEELSSQAQQLNAMVAQLVAVVEGQSQNGDNGAGGFQQGLLNSAMVNRKPVRTPGSERSIGGAGLQRRLKPDFGKEVKPERMIPLDDGDLSEF
jgi:methyl-accepting chemotaxis protein